MKRYNLINNSLGWLCFIIAAITYILTLEPTASFWDCPEFISQGFKTEVGHPPGNPIFILAARFFINFAFGDISKVAYMVNLMSGLLSAGTILLLFWTITHLVHKLVAKSEEITLPQALVIFGSGICGALAYAWSDTFWFSAVEGEVYAFSSFCTALVFWLILKWENRADQMHSDKYLIFIAYIIGISIAVHLLNLLCIPAIGLVIYYRLNQKTTATGSLMALLLSAVVVGLILYGLVPGFIEVSQYFELFFVNVLGMSYNVGVGVYAILAFGSFIWAVAELYMQSSVNRIRFSCLLAIFFSGIPFIGSSMWIPAVIMIAVIIYLFYARRLPVRILNLVVTSILVIFIGYSSYALLLIRSNANPPMNQNAPNNVFALASYLNREQYGDRPLFYGNTVNSSVVYQADGYGNVAPMTRLGDSQYAQVAKSSDGEKDHYNFTGYKKNYVMNPELDMAFPRIYSSPHASAYADWAGFRGRPVNATTYVDADGNTLQQQTKMKPTWGENLRFFMVYQLNHMYWRYFMWNFAGRQNDIQGNGEVNHGNWISGIPFIDNPRLGDQSLLPYDDGEGNKGHNVFYLLPLLMGIIGLGWQAFTSKKGIEQFWVIFFLFFMTGIAIVLYLNQTPAQPRERDYAFAGSFYAFAIWLGMGVAGLSALLNKIFDRVKKKPGLIPAVVACAVGIFVPIQMVSQTWDDHDRSNRYTTRDFGMNYLSSVDRNGIIFTNGDNDTFPLWYAQEVEGYRTDVKVVNLSYLTTDWYANQVRHPSYQAPGVKISAPPTAYAYDRMQFSYIDPQPSTDTVDVFRSLAQVYDPNSSNNAWSAPTIKNPVMSIPANLDQAVAAGVINQAEATGQPPFIIADMNQDPGTQAHGGMSLSQILSLDMIASSAADGWKRPVFFASTVPTTEYYLGLAPYMRSTGMAYQVTPVRHQGNTLQDVTAVNTDKAFKNITRKFRWGGLDQGKNLYLDETVRRMVTTTRSYMLDLVAALVNEGAGSNDAAYKKDRFDKAITILELMQEKLPSSASPYAVQIPQKIANAYTFIGQQTGNQKFTQKGLKVLEEEMVRYAPNIRYYNSLTPWQRSTLQAADRFIDQAYILYLLQDYVDAGGDPDAMIDRLEKMGVDLNRMTRK